MRTRRRIWSRRRRGERGRGRGRRRGGRKEEKEEREKETNLLLLIRLDWRLGLLERFDLGEGSFEGALGGGEGNVVGEATKLGGDLLEGRSV